MLRTALCIALLAPYFYLSAAKASGSALKPASPSSLSTWQDWPLSWIWESSWITPERVVDYLNVQSGRGKVDLPRDIDLISVTARELAVHLNEGKITSVQLVKAYLRNIEKNNLKGLALHAVIEAAPYDNVIAIAQQLDELRANGTVLSELHGIPILVKDNIDTDPELGMNTTAGSTALLGSRVKGDAPIIAKLRAKGAIIIGKANMSQWANFKDAANIKNGWSSRGGRTKEVYSRKNGDPGGSSSGSGVGVAAGYAAIAIGSETDGSIMSPSSRAALYGIKPSVGLIPRTGIIPISSTQDTAGPMAKSVYDAALLLENMVGYDERDSATHEAVGHTHSNYTQFALNPTFKGKRLGIPRQIWGAGSKWATPEKQSAEVERNRVFNNKSTLALHHISSLSAQIIDNLPLPSFDEFVQSDVEGVVLRTDFKVDLEGYLGGRVWEEGREGEEVRTLEDLINFNDAHADVEMPPHACCQREFIQAVQTTGKDSAEYKQARIDGKRLAATEGIDALLEKYKLDALVVPTEGMGTSYPAVAGYPIVTVPLGLDDDGSPFGLSFIGTKWSEPTLIGLMAAFEANFPARELPPKLKRNY